MPHINHIITNINRDNREIYPIRKINLLREVITDRECIVTDFNAIATYMQWKWR